MKIAKQTEDKIKRLQLYEQNMQALAMQKQQFQTQLIEVETALGELEHAEVSYKIVGNIMVKSDRERLRTELNQKKDMITVRVKSLEKQEESVREKSKSLQQEVLGEMKDEEK